MKQLAKGIIYDAETLEYSVKPEDGKSFIIKAFSTKPTKVFAHVKRAGLVSPTFHTVLVEPNRINDLILSGEILSFEIRLSEEVKVELSIEKFKPGRI